MTVNAICRFSIKALIVGLLLMFSLTASHFSVEKLSTLLLSEGSLQGFIWVTGLFIINFYIVAARLYLFYKQLHISVSYQAAKRAIIAGQIGGLLPVFGAALGQSLNLKNSANVSPTVSTFIYFYERIVMAASGAIISLIIVYFKVENGFSFVSGEESTSLLEYIAILPIVLIATWYKGLSRGLKLKLKGYLSLRNMLYISSGTVLSLCSWAISALCFSICLSLSLKHFPGQSISMLNIFLFSVLVSFLASLPFSVNGWGIREFSAISLFGLLAIPTEISLFASLSVGVFSLLAIFLLGIFYYFKKDGPPSENNPHTNVATAPCALRLVKAPIGALIDKQLVYGMGCLVAVFIFFQAHFSCGKLNLNINIADIFAICGLIIMLLKGPLLTQLPSRLPHIKAFLLTAVLVFLWAFLWGFYRFGFTGFAFFSKLFGFFVLLGYFSVGALFVDLFSAEKAFKIIFNIMVTVVLCIIAFQITQHTLEAVGVIKYNYYHACLQGYAGNRNAFAMQILCVLAMLLAFRQPLSTRMRWLSAMLLAGTFFTYSRSGIVTSLVLLLLLRGFCFIKTKELAEICLKTVAIVFGIFLMEHCLFWIIEQAMQLVGAQGIQFKSRSMFTVQQYSPGTSDSQRFYSIIEGLTLWIKNPLLGIGLGGFLNHEMIKNGRPLVVHNTFIWLLTEFGLIGASIFCLYGLTLVKHLYRLYVRVQARYWDVQDKLLFNLVVIFVLMGNAHEIFYQRIFWFMFGIISLLSQRRQRLLF